MGSLGVIDTNIQTIIGISRFVALPVGALYQMVGFIIDVLSGFLLAGFCNAVSTLVVTVGIAFVILLAAYQLVQLIISVDVGTLLCLVCFLIGRIFCLLFLCFIF